MKVFDDRDAPYLEWLHQHPNDYVLNRRRGSSDNYLVLHLAVCGMIRNYTQMARSDGFTGRGYIKVCSTKLESLHQYGSNSNKGTKEVKRPIFMNRHHSCSDAFNSLPNNHRTGEDPPRA